MSASHHQCSAPQISNPSTYPRKSESHVLPSSIHKESPLQTTLRRGNQNNPGHPSCTTPECGVNGSYINVDLVNRRIVITRRQHSSVTPLVSQKGKSQIQSQFNGMPKLF